MRLALPPLDAHAHVDTTISPEMLRELRAVVVAVTREPDEWRAALARRDSSTFWAIGAHPGVMRGLEAFDATRFEPRWPTPSSWGRSGSTPRARTDRELQRRVFDAVLDGLLEQPRPVTIHSTAASEPVLAALRARPVAAPILHWWRGEPAQTQAAVDLGCFLGQRARGTQATRPGSRAPRAAAYWTDFPHARRYDRTSTRPGMVRPSRLTSSGAGTRVVSRFAVSFGITSVRCSQQRRSSIECPAGSSRRSRPPATEAGTRAAAVLFFSANHQRPDTSSPSAILMNRLLARLAHLNADHPLGSFSTARGQRTATRP